MRTMTTLPHLPLAQAESDLAAIKSFIAVKYVASFRMPLACNKLAMSALINAQGASITTFAAAKGGHIARSPSPIIKNRRLANK